MKEEIKRKFDEVENAIEFIRLLEEQGEVNKIGVVGEVDIDNLLKSASKPVREEPEEFHLEEIEPDESEAEGAKKPNHPGGEAQGERCEHGARQKQALQALKQIPSDEWVTSKQLVERTNPEGPDNWGHATARAALSKLFKKDAVDRKMDGQTAYYRGMGANFRPIQPETNQHEALSIAYILEERGEEVTSFSVAEHTERDRSRVSTNLSVLSKRGFFTKTGTVEGKRGSDIILRKLTAQAREEIERLGTYTPNMED